MDPTTNLAEQRDIARRVLLEGSRSPTDDLLRLAELVVSLDGWLQIGGAMPDQWPHGRRAALTRP